MSRILNTLLFLVLTVCTINAQTELQGAWKLKTTDNVTKVLLFSGNYFTWTEYATADGAFIMTMGGNFQKNGKNLLLKLEFHTADSTQVGTTSNRVAKIKKGTLRLKGAGKWMAIDQEMDSPLNHPFLFSGRKRDGELQKRDTNRPRKTMKILTGTRFQWIAYNTATKQFMGTGGGTYTVKDGKYTEHIEFFSRDDSRVGASLEFNFEMKGNDWHHSGKSSKGNPIYEIWTVRE